MGHLRASRDQSGAVVWRSILGQSEVNLEVNLDPYLGNLMKCLKIAFIWPWVGPQAGYMTNMGPGSMLGSTPV